MSLLVAIDFSTVSTSIVNVIADIAKIDDVIYLMHVVEPNPEFVGFETGPASLNKQLEEELQRKQTLLQEHALCMEKLGFIVKQVIVNGVIADEIITYAKKTEARLIVLGRHKHSLMYHLLVGSVAEAVLKKSPIPTVLIPPSVE
jgi:nucleotide-binding universal stress UspA family protein